MFGLECLLFGIFNKIFFKVKFFLLFFNIKSFIYIHIYIEYSLISFFILYKIKNIFQINIIRFDNKYLNNEKLIYHYLRK